MTANRTSWLTGAMDVAPPTTSAMPTMKFQLYLPAPAVAFVSARSQAEYRDGHCVAIESSSRIRVETPATDARSVKKQTILDCPTLYRGAGELRLPAGCLRGGAAMVIEIQTTPLAVAAATGKFRETSRGRVEEFCLAVSRSQLQAHCRDGWTPFWLLTKDQRDARCYAIAQKYGLIRRDDAEAVTVLTNLSIAILSGLDSPVLTEPLKRRTREMSHV